MIYRKISIGVDYPSNVMHYTVGQPILNNTHTIYEINKNEDGDVDVWVESNNGEVYVWKTIASSMPIVLEHNIDF